MSDLPSPPHPTGRPRLDVVIGLGVLAVALASLAISVQTMRATRRMVAAASLPYVTFEHGNYDTGSQRKQVSLILTNKGLGPARLERFQVFIDGKPVRTSKELLTACCGLKDGEVLEILSTPTKGAFFEPHEELDFLRLTFTDQNAAMWKSLDQARWGMDVRYCFCSVFDECWTGAAAQPRPSPVAACPAGEADDYDDVLPRHPPA